LGLAFVFLVWTPCIGPILAGILIYAGTQKRLYQGVVIAYGLFCRIGEFLFCLTALALNKFYRLSGKIKKYFKTIEIVGGMLLILIGILILTDNFHRITSFFIS